MLLGIEQRARPLAHAVAGLEHVAKQRDGAAQHRVAGKGRAPLPHRDVVSRIEAQGADVAEGADMTSGERRPERVAAILDQEQLVKTPAVLLVA